MISSCRSRQRRARARKLCLAAANGLVTGPGRTPVLAHEPLNPFAAHPDALAESQLSVHSRRAVGLPRSGVNVADHLDQLQVGPSAR